MFFAVKSLQDERACRFKALEKGVAIENLSKVC